MRLGILIVPGFCLVLAACGDGADDGLDYAELCATSCEVDKTCDLLDGLTAEQCVTACRETAENQLDGFFEAFVLCKEEKSCEDLSEGGENSTICYDENIAECTTDTADYLEAACAKKLECDGIDEPTPAQMDACKATLHGDGNILRCFTPDKLAETVACIEKATSCSPDPVRDCVDEILGLVLGNENTNPGGGGPGR